jgi:hypothetical protein
MLDWLKEIKNEHEDFDFLTFTSGDNGDSLSITGNQYADSGEPIGGSSIGKQYHIVLFKDHPTDREKFCDVDTFDAILGDPWEYISGLIPAGFYGIIARKTTTSGPIIKKLLADIAKVC